ncbi:MAG: hypothetical protein AB1758_00485 [Candidatus Eremiobacterota bacterium]
MKKNFFLAGALALVLAGQLTVGCSQDAGTTGTTPAPGPARTRAAATPTAGETGEAPGTESPGGETPGAETPGEGASTEGTVMTHEECGVEFVVPAGWNKEESEGALAIESGDGKMLVMFLTPPEENFEDAVNNVAAELDKVIQEAQTDGDPEETEVAGMKAVSLTGTGKVDGKEVAWSMDLIGANKPMMVVSIADKEALQDHMEAYQGMVSSFKKVEGGGDPSAPGDEATEDAGGG